MLISRANCQFPVFVCSASGTPAAVPKLSNAQISEHYSTCIKLSTENVSADVSCICKHFVFEKSGIAGIAPAQNVDVSSYLSL